MPIAAAAHLPVDDPRPHRHAVPAADARGHVHARACTTPPRRQGTHKLAPVFAASFFHALLQQRRRLVILNRFSTIPSRRRKARSPPLTDHLAVGKVRAGTLRRHLAVVHHLLRACKAAAAGARSAPA